MGLCRSRQLLVDEAEDQVLEFKAVVVERWRSHTRHCHRVRRLQRIWGVLGAFLRHQVLPSLRGRLLAVWPQSVPPLALTDSQ